jgi:hypothetical protein
MFFITLHPNGKGFAGTDNFTVAGKIIDCPKPTGKPTGHY